MRETRGAGVVVVATLVMSAGSLLWGCGPRSEPSSTALPTRQTTIDPVVQKLDAAQQEAEKRRAEIDVIGK